MNKIILTIITSLSFSSFGMFEKITSATLDMLQRDQSKQATVACIGINFMLHEVGKPSQDPILGELKKDFLDHLKVAQGFCNERTELRRKIKSPGFFGEYFKRKADGELLGLTNILNREFVSFKQLEQKFDEAANRENNNK